MILHINCLQLLQPFVKYDLLSAQDGTHWWIFLDKININISQQEYIPVRCVPSAGVSISGGWGVGVVVCFWGVVCFCGVSGPGVSAHSGCLLPGVSAPGGVSAPRGRGHVCSGCLLQGVSALGGCLILGRCLLWGVSAPGGCLLLGVSALGRLLPGGSAPRGICFRGVYPTMHWGRHPPVDRQMPVKT